MTFPLITLNEYIPCIVLSQSDILKVDFGVHVKGRIVDSAFTMAWEPTYNTLIEAVKAATNTGVRVSTKTHADENYNNQVLGSRYRREIRRASRPDPRDNGVLRSRG
jgi:hypothetical protein